MIHKLIIDDRKIETVCGIGVIAFYPQANEIMTKEGATERVIFDNELVTCDRCHGNLK